MKPTELVGGEKSLRLFARESTLEAVLQRCGDGVAERDRIVSGAPNKEPGKMPGFLYYFEIMDL